jgi:hypothetical protein
MPEAKKNWAPGGNDHLVSHSTSKGLPLGSDSTKERLDSGTMSIS